MQNDKKIVPRWQNFAAAFEIFYVNWEKFGGTGAIEKLKKCKFIIVLWNRGSLLAKWN